MLQNDGPRLYAPATGRNREPILGVLRAVLPAAGTVLEIAAGSGEHAVFFAPRLKPRRWLPSDPDPGHRASIDAWRAELPCAMLAAPIDLDASRDCWPMESGSAATGDVKVDLAEPITAIVCINMIHIAPWEACLGLLKGSQRLLPRDGILYLYGPYKRAGRHTAPSNAVFDQSLKSANAAWGVRNLEDVVAAAALRGLRLQQVVEMPANNLSVVFQVAEARGLP